MTATLAPRGDTRDTILERLRDYIDGIAFWLTYPDKRIKGVVFCDNSGIDLAWLNSFTFCRHADRAIDVLSAPQESTPSGLHYGYNELGIIDFALTHSPLLLGSEAFAKATGRFRFPSFTLLADSIPDRFCSCIDYRTAYRSEQGPPYRARTQLMMFSTAFYCRTLLGIRRRMLEDGISHIEELFPAILSPHSHTAPEHILRWPVECAPLGKGRNGDHYNGALSRAKSYVRGALRKWVPDWWL